MEQTVFILGLSSDIGRAIGERYATHGWRVAGTYRNAGAVGDLVGRSGFHLYACDVADPASIRTATRAFVDDGGVWDTFISGVGTEEPIGPFFRCDFDAWEASIRVNATAPLRALHYLHPVRRRRTVCNAVFFAGGGTNGPVRNYSAYCVSKIFLIKMCELLDDENEDLNVFIIGPGFVHTKIHRQTLAAGEAAGPGFGRLLDFLETPGTSMDDVHDCVEWCIAQGRAVAGGRNFSVVHDPWRTDGPGLAERLRVDRDKFKLRRSGNAGPVGSGTRSGR